MKHDWLTPPTAQLMREAYHAYLLRLVGRLPQRRGALCCWTRFHDGRYRAWRPRWLLGLVEIRSMPRQRPVRVIEVIRILGWWDGGRELLVHCRHLGQIEGLMLGGMRGFQVLGFGTEYAV